MSNNRTKMLWEVTAAIREEYIEEATVTTPKSRPLWVRFAAAAAALALVLGGLMLWPNGNPQAAYTPFFAIRAYAQDGATATLDDAGDTAPIAVTQSDVFPDKEVYVLDVSLTDTLGNRLDLEGSSFQCFHQGKELPLGQADENLSLQWVEEDDFYGYRLIGWCDEWDYIDITIRDKDDIILHQKTVRIEFAEQYRVDVYTSYTYEANLTTEELIAKLFDSGQRYDMHTAIASTPYVEYLALVNHCGGFAELEEREDAASLLLQRWLREMEQSEHEYTSLEYSGRLGLILAQDAYWDDLTEAEIALVKYRVVTRQKYEGYTPFPGKQTFTYELIMDGHYMSSDGLTVEYNGKEVGGKDEHLLIANVLSASYADPPYHGWHLTGWFDEPTKMTLTVTDKDGNVIRREVILITPIEDNYQIDILEQTP